MLQQQVRGEGQQAAGGLVTGDQEGDQLEAAGRDVQGPDVGRSSLETIFRANPFLRMSCVVGKKKCH